MLPVRKFPPPPPKIAQKNIEGAARKANKARAEKEKFREMVGKNWDRMGTLENFQRNQYERHNLKHLELADRALRNKHHHPMTPMDYSKGLFMRDLLSPTMQMRW